MLDAEAIMLREFAEAGWTANRRPFHWDAILGVRDYPTRRHPHGGELTLYRNLDGANLIATKPGLDGRRTILIGAHLDTVRDSPGANDNTASIAALLELAQILGPHVFRDTLMLAAFDMEEIGMLGSHAFVTALTDRTAIREAIVFENMTYTAAAPGSQRLPRGTGLFYPNQVRRIRRRGYRGDWTLVVHRRDSRAVAVAFAGALRQAAGPDAALLVRDVADAPLVGPLLHWLPIARQLARSDHAPFWQAGIPAILITDTAEHRSPHYHQSTDTSDTLDWFRLAAIVDATSTTLAERAGISS
jgi:Zn-dependent M28 family amino/carboxypeptidase